MQSGHTHPVLKDSDSSIKNSNLCGDDGGKVTPVPIPNTAVKLLSAEDSEGFPFVKAGRCRADYSAIAQSVERMTVNHDVAGSSPACGVLFFCQI